jgi:ribose transport system permease protein
MTTTDVSASAASPAVFVREMADRARRSVTGLRYLGVFVLLVLMFVFFSLTQPGFLTSANLDTMLTGVSILFVVSVGMTFVMLSGGIDLSVGSILAICGIFLGKLFGDMPIGFAIALALLGGAALGGLVNGFLIGRMRLSFLVVTLGTFILLRGALNLWTEGVTIQVISGPLESLAFGKFLGLPNPVWVMVGVAAASLYLLRSTYFGRDVYAVGGNPEAASLSGINVARTIMIVYAISGMLAAFGGVIQVARLGAASPLVGETIVFEAAAAVLIGGTSFRGGIGGVGGTIVGVLFLGVLQNGLAVAGVQSYWQQVITGAILILAVLVDRTQRERGSFLRLRRARGASQPAGS